MSDENLELRLKLWNHLAQHRNLMLSDAWYGTEKQVEGWTNISELERKDPNSNARRELNQLETIIKGPDLNKTMKGKLLMLFDLGAGDGYKGQCMLGWLMGCSQSLTYYVPYDASRLLLRKAVDEIASHHDGVFVQWGDPFLEIAQFMENASAGKFQECIRDLQEYLKLPRLLDSFLTDAEYTTKLIEETITEAISTARPKVEQLQRELEELNEVKNRNKLQKKLIEIRKKYNPEVVQTLNEVFKLSSKGDIPYTQALMATLCDSKFIKPNEYTEHIGMDGEIWAMSTPVISQGLKADFSQTQCKEIALIRDNGAAIKDFIINTAYAGEDYARQRELHTKWNIKATGIIALLGQTLGNFKPEQQAELLQNLYFAMKPKDVLLLGVECRPEPNAPEYESKIEALANKYKGDVADGFLKETTRLLGIPDEAIGKLDARFRNNSVEMFYRVSAQEGISVPHPLDKETRIHFGHGKEILCATSYKFTPSEVHKLLEDARFTDIKVFPDRTDYIVVKARK